MPKHTGLIDHDPASGVTKLFHRLHDGDWAYETLQDVAPILEANKAAQNSGLRPDGEFRKVASLPLVMIQKLWDEKGIDVFDRDHWPALKRLLNDPEYRFFRTDDTVL